MTKYIVWKIKPGKRTVWEKWCKSIMTSHQQEALETLIEEDLVHEKCLILGKGDESYVLYKHQSVRGKEKKPANMSRSLNKKHFEILYECLERVPGATVTGYDLKVG